jgi:hypothetical protein
MAPKRFALVLVSYASVASWSPLALAEGILFPGTRPLGTGGAMRAIATGDSGPELNPSGISLMRTYQVEGSYQYGRTMGSTDARLSAVDSTSAFNLGGALNYTYHRASAGGVTETGHIIGVSLSFPFLEKIFVGGTAKYLHFGDNTSGFTFDAGLTVRPMSSLSFGVAGYNLRDFGIAWVPRGVGGGVAVLPSPMLIFVFDTVYERVYGNPARDDVVHYMGGGELSFSSSGAIRAGGGWNGLTKNGYVSAGVSALSAEVGALDVGLRQDVSGESRTTIVGISVRLFVPGM